MTPLKSFPHDLLPTPVSKYNTVNCHDPTVKDGDNQTRWPRPLRAVRVIPSREDNDNEIDYANEHPSNGDVNANWNLGTITRVRAWGWV